MKLLIIGSSYAWSLESYYLNHLTKIKNLEIDFFSTSEFEKNKITLIYKIERRLFPNKDKYYKILNNDILNKCEKFKPDVILIFKGMEIFPDTLVKIRTMGIKLVNYNPDHPFIIFSRGSGNLNVLKSVSLYSLHFSYNLGVIKEIESRFVF